MGNLASALQKKIKSLGIERQVEAADVVERATKEISKYVSMDDFDVISYKNNVLKVVCSGGAASSEISFLTPGLRKKISQSLRVVILQR